jgi:hypothetical protein
MAQKIYGVDPDQPITPLMVRDAIIECFTQAHCVYSSSTSTDKELNEQYCRGIVLKAFADSEGNFDSPTKDDIVGVMRNLASFSKNFRDPSLVEKHYQEIMVLVEKMK